MDIGQRFILLINRAFRALPHYSLDNGSIFNECLFSPGRNNVISGVAKTIKTHFKKHPLAIVNIKHRAKGTPVQELIFELEVCASSLHFC